MPHGAVSVDVTSLLWDQHLCLPLQTDTDVDPLTRYQRPGGAFVSVNAGYAPHNFNDTLALLRHYRAAVKAHRDLDLAASIDDVVAITGAGRIAVDRLTTVLGRVVPLRTLMTSDPPDHTQLRRKVSRAFTPRRINAWEPRIWEIAARLVEDIASKAYGEPIDLVASLASPLPTIVIAEMMGIPRIHPAWHNNSRTAFGAAAHRTSGQCSAR